MTNKPMSAFDAAMIMDGEFELAGYEPQDRDEAENLFIEAAQTLIDNGMAWTLQGRVGRTCAYLIEQGLCHTPK